MLKTRATVVPLYAPDDDPSRPALPDEGLLDPEEAAILSSLLSDHGSCFASVRKQTRSRLQGVRAAVEVSVDRLADGAHLLDRRVAAAVQEADVVLALSAERLREREEKERAAAGTKELPSMEVLRSLSRLLPDEGS